MGDACAPGQIHHRHLPGHTTIRVIPEYDARQQAWYEGDCWNEEAMTPVGPLPIPDALPPLLQYAVGLCVNGPVKSGLAEALVRKYDPRLAELVQEEEEEAAVEVPLICGTCLGPSTQVTLHRHVNEGVCQVCRDAYPLLVWKPDAVDARLKTRYKRTVICRPCAASRNVCQTCLFDMQYALPSAVRDRLIA
eukprot:CAMPEP_0172182228 /NCGR_PEP_ID=MMETSP1050-20130122/18280_1 /TAXON_ID=233186 /ORGANISM="Cryptomonas curvata, Strain CCAP979/52" /LENGTH=191 /DNA_ID=CAMNT_0012855645 /DNA_START=404 /DNA_END=976 /DNA_ORIENTATION=-